MTVVTPTDRPKSVRSRCVIEVLVAFLCCHVAFWIFRRRGFCHRTESDLFFFLLKPELIKRNIRLFLPLNFVSKIKKVFELKVRNITTGSGTGLNN